MASVKIEVDYGEENLQKEIFSPERYLQFVPGAEKAIRDNQIDCIRDALEILDRAYQSTKNALVSELAALTGREGEQGVESSHYGMRPERTGSGESSAAVHD